MPFITTNDGVRLNLVEHGSGRPLVLVPGWSQTARQFAAQIEGLADRYRVIAIDMRGHGQSEKPAHGYKIQRLAQDLKDVLDALDLRMPPSPGTRWAAPSCGATGTCSARIGSEAPSSSTRCPRSPRCRPGRRRSGCSRARSSTMPACRLRSRLWPARRASRRRPGSSAACSPPAYPRTGWPRWSSSTCRCRAAHAAALLYNHATQDWRDVIPRVGWRTLVVGGKASFVSWQSQNWIHQQIRRLAAGAVRRRRRRTALHVHGEPGQVQRRGREFLG